MKLQKKVLLRSILFLIIIFAVTCLLARAGGAGSSGRGSSSGGDDGMIIWLVIELIRFIWIVLPFPVNLIVTLALLGAAAYIGLKSKDQVQQRSVFNDIPAEAAPKKKIKGFSKFLDANPDFNESEFTSKVSSVFLQVQDAWMKMDLKNVRKFMSDGVYQRFTTQFKMMGLLQQKNELSNIHVSNVFIDKVEKDGDFDIIHVGIMATMNDAFISELDSSLNSSGYNEFVEYWSFIRKRGIPRKDMFDTPGCPNCGGNLEAGLGELCQCPYCSSIINSGEYDWVLSEITQADDYVSRNPKLQKRSDLSQKIQTLVTQNEDFAVQFVEDKASNGYLQILTAKAFNDPSLMRRFVSDSYFQTFEKERKDRILSYNRLFLNDVTLVAIQEEQLLNRLFISVTSSFQRVEIKGEAVSKIDPFVITETEVLVMSREKNASKPKLSIYSHNCPSCGGAIKDTIDITCQYCGNALNSRKHEWIVEDVMSLDQYSSYHFENRDSFEYSVKPKFIESMYDVRDFALNNVLVIAAADNRFDETELELVNQLAKKWGYKPEKIRGLINLAAGGSLSIKMPGEMKKREKIFKLMKKAAMADGVICSEEQELLDAVSDQYLDEAV